MQPDEEVVSDVHLFLLERDRTHQLPNRHFGSYPAYFSRFVFRNLAEEEEEEEETAFHESDSKADCKGLRFDDDGDLVLLRRWPNCSEVVYLEHALKTRLPDVGLQVWPGCMILCDFIMDNWMTFDDKVVVELGAGVGFSSIVASMFARRVIATDVNADVLKASSYNATLNKHLINSKCSKLSATTSSSSSSSSPPPPRMEVCHFDWFSLSNGKNSFSSNKIPPGLKILSTDITGADFVLDMDEADILIASDVVYSDDVTDAFFRSVYEILRTSLKCRTLVMSVEKRLNFTLEDLDIASPAYSHFRDCLAHLSELFAETKEKITIELITDIRQYFEYQRSQYLELWRLSVEKSDQMKSAA